MPTEILIFSRKNGRALKTYGVRRPDHIMKFTFICIVVVLSCGYCASGDLEIYPRLRLNFNDDRKYRFKKYDKPDFFNKYGFQFPLEDFRDTESSYNSVNENLAKWLNELKQFEEETDYEKVRLMLQHHQENPDSRFKHRLEVEEKTNFKPSNLLEEARVYAQDDDFKFIIDDNEEGNAQSIIGRPKYTVSEDNDRSSTPVRENIIEDANMEDMGHNMEQEDDQDDNDDNTKRFQGLKVMDRPSEFAYPPSDPRFYRKTGEEKFDITQILKHENPSPPVRTSNDALSVTYRSEHRQQQMKVAVPEDDTTDISPQFGGADVVAVKPSIGDMDSAGVYVIAIVAGISAAATVGLIAVGIGWYNLQKHVKNATDVEYPAYGITGPNKDLSPSGDRRLAQSAQMYHYQHQKQQIIAMESAQPSFAISRAQPGERHGSVSDADSEEENEEGDYTVYECPGLAPTGEMEVKNPLFQDDPTPAQTPAVKNTTDEKK